MLKMQYKNNQSNVDQKIKDSLFEYAKFYPKSNQNISDENELKVYQNRDAFE
jgi:hypothetical protein